MKRFFPIAGVAALVALSACGGGGTTTSIVPIAQPAPRASSAPLGTASATFTIRVPKSAAAASSGRQPLYVSPSAASIKIETLSGSTTTAQTVAPISSGSPGCSTSTSSLACTVSVAVAPGPQQFRLSVYASVDASGTALGIATVGSTITVGQANNVNVTLGGVVASLAFSQTRIPVAADGTTHVLSLNVTAKDAAGAVIVAPGDFYSSITLAKGSDDPSNALTLPASTAIVTPSANGANGFTVSYDSTKPLTSGTITASAANASSASVTITPLHYAVTSGTLLAGSSNPTLSLTVSEAGTSGPFTATSSPATAVTISGNGTASAASVGGTAIFTLAGGSTGGTATITIGDGTASGTVTVSVTGTSTGIAVPSQPIVTEFGVSAEPNDIVTGPDGNLWFTETLGNKIGRMTTGGVLIAEYPVTSPPFRITTGPDGSGNTAIWFTEVGAAHASKIGRLSVPANPAVAPTRTEIDILTPNAHAVGIVAGPDGNMWFTEEDANKIGKLVPATGVITEFASVGTSPRDITVGPDGALWFTEHNYLVNPNLRKIGRITTSGTVSEKSIDPSNAPSAMQPAAIALGADGNLWFSEYDPNTGNGPVDIGKMTPSGTVTLYTTGLTQGSSPDGLKLLRDGNIWFIEGNSSNTVAKIARITPGGTINEFSLHLTQTAGPAGLTSGSDGNVWITEFNTFAIGRVRF